MLDTLIFNAAIYDGSGQTPFQGYVGIQNGIIVEVGTGKDLPDTKQSF